jgi:hypothetical protein
MPGILAGGEANGRVGTSLVLTPSPLLLGGNLALPSIVLLPFSVDRVPLNFVRMLGSGPGARFARLAALFYDAMS